MPSREDVEQATKKTLKFVSPYTCTALVAAASLIGFLGCLYLEHEPEVRVPAFFVAIAYAILIRQPLKMWRAWVQDIPEDKLIDGILSNLNVESKPDKNSFSQDDFDEHTRVQILKMVREARKNGVKVTTPVFIQSVLQSIK